jgi:predicted ABC-type ATPase
VLAGVNGAGKSSLAGAAFLAHGVDFFNPDTTARGILEANPGLDQTDANSIAWRQGKRLLERAIAERLNFAFETTLGGKTIAGLLETAALSGIHVRIWYVGLRNPELHIARVRSRVAKGGHDVSEQIIRARFDSSRMNLIRLLPHIEECRVHDNSKDADPKAGFLPEPILLLHVAGRIIVASCKLTQTPDWAKPLWLRP